MQEMCGRLRQQYTVIRSVKCCVVSVQDCYNMYNIMYVSTDKNRV